ncbi:DUF2726 domain-containing protein [Vibrio fluvialis]|nr:DUF2726 domain-containing protein [Vibrio fluvialis]MBY7977363.1 DUF2726 domain-containing protein [Vibrio fluvialis]
MDMKLLLGLVALIVIYLILRPKKSGEAYPLTNYYEYDAHKNLMSIAELSFYHALNKAVGDEYLIFAKVRIADVLKPKKNLYHRSEWQKAFNRISSKHFDFVLCDPKTMAICKVIELNDSSHQKPDRVRRDSFVQVACATADLPLIMIDARRSYQLSELKSQVEENRSTEPSFPEIESIYATREDQN